MSSPSPGRLLAGFLLGKRQREVPVGGEAKFMGFSDSTGLFKRAVGAGMVGARLKRQIGGFFFINSI